MRRAFLLAGRSIGPFGGLAGLLGTESAASGSRCLALSCSLGTLKSGARACVCAYARENGRHCSALHRPLRPQSARKAADGRTTDMTKSLIIAEKPSVAQDIVRALTPAGGQVRQARRSLRERSVTWSPRRWAIWWRSRRPRPTTSSAASGASRTCRWCRRTSTWRRSTRPSRASTRWSSSSSART